MPRRKRTNKRADYGLSREEIDRLLISGEWPDGWAEGIFDTDWWAAVDLWEHHRDRIKSTYAGSYGEEHIEPLGRSRRRRKAT
jgi:hypothetical protein